MKAIVSHGIRSTERLVIFASTLGLLLALPVFAVAGSEALPCTGLVIETQAGSEIDEGWTGHAHNRPLATGSTTSWAVLKRCSNDQSACNSDDDCGGGTCVATCDCNGDPTCELTGPVDARKCQSTLADCTTNADCPMGIACVSTFGPPLPVSLNASPYCAVTHFEGESAGTFHSATGEASLSLTLRRRIYFGINSAQPCPRCGAPNQDPEIGDIFTCEGGQFPGATCTVEGVTPTYGGTSSACPPSNASNLSGSGLAIRISNLTTAAVSRTAQLPCHSLTVQANPLTPASNPKCIDDIAGAVCENNADCTRCTGDPTIKCSSNGDCSGNGICAQAPDQPITCGYWCHCGFCNNDGTRPCFENSECPDGQTCVKGTGGGTSANAPQQKPNECSMDASICGGLENELCEDTKVNACSLQPYRTCSNNSDCEAASAGTCVVSSKPCFESRIARSGTPSPVGNYCAFEDKSCTSNADCTTESGDFCASDSARPQMVAAFCVATSSSSPLNGIIGLAGPAALTIDSFVKVCRCGAGETECGSLCEGGGADCGNGIVEAGEDCDGGSCCSQDCTLLSSATVCRASAGACDAPEACSGSSASCPANGFQPSAVVCRAAGGICDIAESCSGTSAACPVDAFATSATTCRTASGDCDIAESCSGSAATCPANASQPDGTECDDGNACTTEECVGGTCEATEIPDCGAVCGDGELDSGEACDDGNATFTNGEYCGVDCVLIPCGRPTNSMGVRPVTSDALYVLRAAIGQGFCSPRVCSVDGNSTVVASDALLILRAAVGQQVTLQCPLA